MEFHLNFSKLNPRTMLEIKGYLHPVLIILLAPKTFCNSDELCEPWKRVQLLNTEHFANDTVWDHDNKLLYPPDSYWEQGEDNKPTTLFGCPCKLDKPCMRKCCQKNEAMDYGRLQCSPHDSPWPWFLPNVTSDEEGNFRIEDLHYFGLTFGNYCLGYLLEPEMHPEDDKFFVNFTDGTLSIPMKNKTGLGPEDYCLAYLPEKDAYLPYVCKSSLSALDPPTDLCDKLRYIFYPLGMLISTVFLVISLCVYSLIPDLRNIHGKCLMCQMTSLLCSYVCLATVQGIGKLLSDDVCVSFGFIIYFSALCSFFWLNVMCIDICMAFRTMRPMNTLPEREMKKFLLYMTYAWGGPLLIILFTVIMELHPKVPDTFYKPKFKRTCWFNSEESKMAYFVAPVGVLVFCNIILFLVTACIIAKMKKDTKMVNEGANRRHDKKEDKNRFELYIKLSIVMGISWVAEILSFLIGGSLCIWLFTDTLNALQGLFIFLIFVWKKKVRHLIKRRLCSKKITDSSIQIDGGSTDRPPGSTSSSRAPSINRCGNIMLERDNSNWPMRFENKQPAKINQENTRL